MITYWQPCVLYRVDLWRLGRLKFLVHSHQLPILSKPLASSAATGKEGCEEAPDTEAGRVIVQAKMEYHSQKATPGELITDGELARWWLASLLHQQAPVWVKLFYLRSCSFCLLEKFLQELPSLTPRLLSPWLPLFPSYSGLFFLVLCLSPPLPHQAAEEDRVLMSQSLLSA